MGGGGTKIWGGLPVEHFVKVADLEHDDVLRLRQLQLSPLVDQTARMAAFIRAASICAT